jgi:CobQ-like glutamine amidotransferase family enzyme
MSVTKEEIYGGNKCLDPKFELNVCHLYGNLMNTYGDNGNILVWKFLGEKMQAKMNFEISSLNDDFNSAKYDLVFFGGGQDYEQRVVATDLPKKKSELSSFIEQGGVMLAICGGYQFLGQYYLEASGHQVEGLGILGHYTVNQQQPDQRFIGDIEIINKESGVHYYGFENHQGRTFLSSKEKPLGYVINGFGNNGEDRTEGVVYRNTYGSYFHGPLLARNPNLAYQMLTQAIINKYGQEVSLPSYAEITKELPSF